MKGWTTSRQDGAITVSRPNRTRFDVLVETTLPGANLSLGRIAHQIRQDVWRACQTTRGFSPVIQVETSEAGYSVVAGGQIDQAKHHYDHVSAQISDVLHNAKNRDRWVINSRRRPI